MNKIATFFLAVFLLLINTRLIQNIHFCDGHICTIQTFIDIEKDTCCHEAETSCCSTNSEDNNCCNDIEINQDLDDLVLEKLNFDINVFFVSHNFFQNYFWNKDFSNAIKINAFEIQSHAPPLYKLYQQYIFYA
jgi:hypothetical protein